MNKIDDFKKTFEYVTKLITPAIRQRDVEIRRLHARLDIMNIELDNLKEVVSILKQRSVRKSV